MPNVRVTQPHGEVSFQDATADIFEADALTVTFVASDQIAQVFQADDWTAVEVFGFDGHPLFSFTNDRAWASHQSSRRS